MSSVTIRYHRRILLSPLQVSKGNPQFSISNRRGLSLRPATAPVNLNRNPVFREVVLILLILMEYLDLLLDNCLRAEDLNRGLLETWSLFLLLLHFQPPQVHLGRHLQIYRLLHLLPHRLQQDPLLHLHLSLHHPHLLPHLRHPHHRCLPLPV